MLGPEVLELVSEPLGVSWSINICLLIDISDMPYPYRIRAFIVCHDARPDAPLQCEVSSIGQREFNAKIFSDWLSTSEKVPKGKCTIPPADGAALLSTPMCNCFAT